MVMVCAGLLSATLLVNRAMLPIVLMCGSYNHHLMPKFNLIQFKQNFHYLLYCMDKAKICNTKAVVICSRVMKKIQVK